jgi:arylsulfatase A-like enzyme
MCLHSPESASNKLPGSNYGFSETHFCLEHGDEVGGDFARWLQEQTLAEGEAPGLQHALPPEKAIAAPQAWRTSLDRSHYPTSYIEETTCSWLLDHAAKKDRRAPFFIQCSFPDPHHPFTPPEPYWSMYRPEDIELPASFYAPLDEAPPHKLALHRELAQGERKTGGSRVIAVREDEARQAIALNYGSITMIDDAVGRILETLGKTGLADNTVVIFMSDHGDYMGDHGLLFKGPLHYQSIIRMPFLWKDTPASFHPGRRRDSVCAMDLAPSILERAGLEGWHGIQGKSLLGIIRTPEASGREAQAARTPDMPILIEEQSHRKVPGLPDPPKVRTLISGRWRLSLFADAGWGELYDLEEDPDELHNRFEDPSCEKVKCELLFTLGTEMTRLSPDMPLSARMA